MTSRVATPVHRPRALGAAHRLQLTFRLVMAFTFIVVVAGWAVFLRPRLFGGPASYVIVSGTSMQPALHTGDLVIALQRPAYHAGEVIAYHVPSGPGKGGALIIHRIIGGSGQIGFLAKGDNREGPDDWRPKQEDVAGRMVLRVPRAGSAMTFLHTPLGMAALAALVAFFVMREGRDDAPRGPRTRAAGGAAAGPD
jgi:signal peptidase I